MGTVNGPVPKGFKSWGVDLNQNNLLHPEHWDHLKAQGCDFVILRAAYGTVRDMRFPLFVAEAQKRNIKIGAYMVLRPEKIATIGQQISAFTSVTERIDPFMVALDIEGDWKLTDLPARTLRRALWLLSKQFHIRPHIYTYPTFWKTWLRRSPVLRLFPLWGAWYVPTPRPAREFTFAEVEEKFGRKGLGYWQYGGSGVAGPGTPSISRNVMQ